MTTFTTAKLSAKREVTPEGFLLCKDVRLGRIGEMVYGPGQTPVPVGPMGVARITRDAAVLFHPDTLASFVGKPVTIKHPEVGVTVDNWKDHAAGHILSARRGEPPFADFMVGDVLVTSKDAIELANAGCEISCGYDAAYETTSPGAGRQTKIVGNHLAFLPDGIKGRCGPMCYVGDQSMDIEEPKMTTESKSGLSLLQKLLGAKDEGAAQSILTQAAADEAMTATNAKIDALAGTVDSLAKVVEKLVTKDSETEEESEEDKKKREAKEKGETKDAAHVARFLAEVAPAAEILAPGTKIATHDGADLTATFDAACACQKAALKTAYATDVGKKAIDTFTKGAALDGLTQDQLDRAFFGASALIGALNNNVLEAMAMAAGSSNEFTTSKQRLLDADKRSQERWGKTQTAH